MKSLRSLSAEQRRLILGLAVVFALAIVLRLNIGWSFSNNGIDEGIMLQRAMLLSNGYQLYADVPCDQAPLAFLIGSVFGGDVVSLRSMSAVLSLVAIAACMMTTRKLGSERAMLITGFLLATDFVFLRESRLFSLDGMTASVLAIAVFALVPYLKTDNRLSLAAGAFTIGIATSIKLLGVLALGGLLVLLIFEIYKDKSMRKARTLDLLIAIISGAVPIAVLMLVLGPSEMIDGMLLQQAGRGLDLYLKLSLLAYFGINFAYIIPLMYCRRLWRMGRPERLLLCTSFVMIAFFVVEPLIFLHHMAIVSPFLAILMGVLLKDFLYREKYISKEQPLSTEAKRDLRKMAISVILVVINMTVSTSLGAYGIIMQGEPAEIALAREVSAYTTESDWVVSGSPIIASYAGRMVPPDVVNVAYRQHGDLTEQMLEQAIVQYDVAVVVVCYRLNEFEDLRFFLWAQGYVLVEFNESAAGAALDVFQQEIGNVAIYVRGDLAAFPMTAVVRP